MCILRIVIVCDLLEFFDILYQGLPLIHFAFKFLFYFNFYMMMLEVFSGTLNAEELLLTVWASFYIAVVDLNRFTAAAALYIVRGSPVIKCCYSFLL
jgi:hypothetical protein